MGKTIQNQYWPDVVSAPGETLLETIEALGISQAALAERIGQTEEAIAAIIRGEGVLTPEIALQLEQALGVPAYFWNNRESSYRESLTRQAKKQRLRRQPPTTTKTVARS